MRSVVRPMREKSPPRGVASFTGLVFSMTSWFMLNMSMDVRAARGRKKQQKKPVLVEAVVLLAVASPARVVRATTSASTKKKEKVTTQASRA